MHLVGQRDAQRVIRGEHRHLGVEGRDLQAPMAGQYVTP